MVPPPQPLAAATAITNSSMPTSVCHLRRRDGKQKINSAARAPLPPSPSVLSVGLRYPATLAPAVVMVSVAVTGCVPEMLGGCVTEHVGELIAAAGLLVRAHASVTVPAKAPLGVTVMGEVAFAPAEEMVIGAPLSEKDGVIVGAVTVIVMLVVSVRVPELPDTFAE